MPLHLPRRALSPLALAALPGVAAAQQAADPLPTWRDGPARRAILDFLAAVTTEGAPDFVPPAQRLAVFDNDGTLWVEQPVYPQAAFAFDRARILAAQRPDLAAREPFRSLLANDMTGVMRGGERGVQEIVGVTHSGMTAEAFRGLVGEWLSTARHPRFGRPYTECVYQPMLEVLALFRRHGFRTCIVSGGTAEFMRGWAERTYGIPPEQVVGTTFRLRYEVRDGRGDLIRLPEIEAVDDGPGKPAAISRFLGQRPVAAFGNSDGDYEMLEYVTTGPGRRLGVIVHHDDAEREYAYDRQSRIGRLDRALTDLPRQRWIRCSMRDEWRRMFPWG